MLFTKQVKQKLKINFIKKPNSELFDINKTNNIKYNL